LLDLLLVREAGRDDGDARRLGRDGQLLAADLANREDLEIHARLALFPEAVVLRSVFLELVPQAPAVAPHAAPHAAHHPAPHAAHHPASHPAEAPATQTLLELIGLQPATPRLIGVARLTLFVDHQNA